jgi:hypothetical protein
MDARRLLPLREQRPSSSATGWLLGTNRSSEPLWSVLLCSATQAGTWELTN